MTRLHTLLLAIVGLLIGFFHTGEALGASAYQGTRVHEIFGGQYFLDTYPSGTTPANKTPLILIHGINLFGHSEKSDGWDNFITYIESTPALNSRYKIYRFGYTSNQDSVLSLGQYLDLCLNSAIDDPSNGFGNKDVVIVAHSMGGLVARRCMEQLYHNTSDKWHQHVIKLITLATPHHGTPAANESLLVWDPLPHYIGALGVELGSNLLTAEFAIAAADASNLGGFFGVIPYYNAVNRSDLLWDNYDGLFTTGFDTGEDNPSTKTLNQITSARTYDNKIIAYAGYIDHSSYLGKTSQPSASLAIGYQGIARILANGLGIPNDGLVPLVSAQFTTTQVKTRVINDHDHTQMWQAADNNLDTILHDEVFTQLGSDLLAALPAAPSSPTITSGLTATATQGVAFSYTITASNSPTSYGASGLPTGLSVNTSTGVVSGTPSASGTFSATLIATNGNGTGSVTLVLTVIATPQRPDILPQNISLSSNTVPAGGALTVTFGMHNQGNANAVATTTRLRMNQSSTTTSVNDAPLGDVSTPSISVGSSASSLTKIVTIPSGTATGMYYIWVVADNKSQLNQGAGGVSNDYAHSLSFTVQSTTPPGPAITSGLSLAATQGQAFNYAITASNNPTSYGASGLPSGLNVDTASGAISGSPSVVGTFNIALSATNSGGTDHKTLVLTVAPTATIPTIATPTISPASGNYSNPVQVTLACSTPGSAIRYTIDGTDPTLNYLTYTGAFTLTGSSVVKAKGVGAGNDSPITSASYTIAASPTQTRLISLTGNMIFGTVPFGSTAQRTLTINNTGNSPLTVNSINLPFSVFSVNWSSGTIPVNGMQAVTVTFSPVPDNGYSGNIEIISNATSGVNTIPVTGSGAANTPTRTISLTGNMTFGGVGVGDSMPRYLTIANVGNSPLTISSIDLPAGFIGNWFGTIQPGKSVYAQIAFSPTSAITYNGVLTANSDFSGGANTLPISGAGVTVSTTTVLTTLRSFSAPTGTNARNFAINSDGIEPEALLVQGADGYFYGTSFLGGAYGYGSVWKTSSNGLTFTTLHSFSATTTSPPYTNSDGVGLMAGLVKGNDAAFYGTATYGGANAKGTVFKISSDGSTFTVLRAFNGSDGAYPYGGLLQGKDGNFYGTTYGIGANSSGTVFKISSDGTTFVTLHTFSALSNGTSGSNNDGAGPKAGLVQGSDDYLYGTAYFGGANTYGTVYKVSTDGQDFRLLHTFDGNEGGGPNASLALGTDGKVYGTAGSVIFKMSSDGNSFEVLHTFNGNIDGNAPNGLTLGSDGNFYGTTQNGGVFNNLAYNNGMVFRIASDGSAFGVLHTFHHDGIGGIGSEGAYPHASLTQGSDGNFYGTTYNGGVNNEGTIFGLSLGNNSPVNATLFVQPNLSNGGTVSGAGSYAVNSSQQINATANPNWTFMGWSDGNVQNPRTVTVLAAGVTYTANFTQQTATLTVLALPAYGGTGSGGATLSIGTAQQISATPNAGWAFTAWSDGNTQNPRTVTIPLGGVAYTANFAQIYTVTPSAGLNGSITPSTLQSVNSGGSLFFTATPAGIYGVDQWLVNGTPVQNAGNNYTLNSITANNSVQVTFKIAPISFSQWQVSHFMAAQLIDPSLSGWNGDANGSGISNGLKFLFDLNSTAPMTASDSSALPRAGVEMSGGLQYLTLTYRQNPQASAVGVQLQVSPNLTPGSWLPVTPDFTQSLTPDPVTGDPRTKVMVNVTGQTKKFIRLQVTGP